MLRVARLQSLEMRVEVCVESQCSYGLMTEDPDRTDCE